MMDLQSHILEKLCCSKCNAYLSYTPIMITQDGENLCGRCIPESPDNTLIRNKAYEVVASITAFPCHYKESGCEVVVPWEDIMFHENHCEYRLIKCPVASTGTCDWEGCQNSLLDHFKETHPELILEHPYSLDTNIVVDNDKNMLLSFLGFIFLVQIRCNTSLSKLWHCVHCLTHPIIVQQFNFSVQFSNNEDSVKKEKATLASERLTMRPDKSIETNVNHLLGILGDYKNIKCVLSILPKVDFDLQYLFLCPICKDSKLPAVFRNNNEYSCSNCKQYSCSNCKHEGSYLDRNMEYLYGKILKPCRNNNAGCSYFNINTKSVNRHVIYECKWQQNCVLECKLSFNELQDHYVNITHESVLNEWLKIDSWHYGQMKVDDNIILYKILMERTILEVYIYTQLSVEEIRLYKCIIQFERGSKVILKCNSTAEHDWGICKNFENNPHIDTRDNTFMILNIIISKNK